MPSANPKRVMQRGDSSAVLLSFNASVVDDEFATPRRDPRPRSRQRVAPAPRLLAFAAVRLHAQPAAVVPADGPPQPSSASQSQPRADGANPPNQLLRELALSRGTL